MVVLALLVGCAGTGGTVTRGARAADRAEVEQARALVERACALDFEGHAERYDFAVLSEERARQLKEQEVDLPLVFAGAGEPFVAVTGYRVLSVEVSGDVGTALVRYERLAESPGGAVVQGVPARTEEVRLSLRREGGQWWLVDPPPAHVGIDALIAAYEADLAYYTPEWEKTATDVQKASRDTLVTTLARLEALRTRR